MKKGNAAIALQSLNKIADSYFDYKKVKEVEITNRMEIKAKRDVAIEAIRSNREVMLYALEETFKERGKTLDQMFQGLDRAIEEDNIEYIDRFLSGIVTTIQTSPFRGFGEFQKSVGTGEHVLKLD
ncbi:hypothetical protein [Halalkalibacter alkaliphilus]|uniref:Uncharacterized protein n=1 Tax=Halalkalibacter alkaliphilus TaxID=2917993 RepID=A0A9X2IA88_9BACI|nr:hypothetical protein [Halalkalibacter alkaliphilus]MCL7749215.1 hypothetical protein [Halalkalibacter alkaliphilus]